MSDPRDAKSTPNSKRSKMAKAAHVHRYWVGERAEDAAVWFDQFDLGEPSCYACGWYADAVKPDASTFLGLERGHLVDHALGGSPGPENLILLCKPCNKVMPMFRPGQVDEAIAWVRARRSWLDAARPDAEDVVRQIEAAGEVPAWLARTLAEGYPEMVAGLHAATVDYLGQRAADLGELFPA